MSVRIMHKTLMFALAVLVLGVAALTLTPQGYSIAGRITEKYKTGILEQTAFLTIRRIIARFNDSDTVTDLSVEDTRRGLPETKIIAAIPLTELTPSISLEAPRAPANWQHSFGDSASRKYADIPWLTPDKVQSLKRLWTYETPGVFANIQATPIYTGRVLVFPDARDRIVALAPDTGERVWEFNPAIRLPARRGLIFVPDPKGAQGAGDIYFAAMGKLFSLNAVTVRPNTDFGDEGAVSVGYTVRTAPQVRDDVIYVASFMPGIHAFNRHTGERLWTTDLIAGKVTETFLGRWTIESHVSDGANPWGGITLDVERGHIFLGLSNPVPVAYGAGRPGNNAPSNSVISIDAATGDLRWRFQEIMHDLWDLDTAAPPVLATIERNTGRWDVVAVPTKAGNLLLLDRLSGRPIFDWRLRLAPSSTVPGERTAAYQPDPVLPEPFGKMTFSLGDVTDIGVANRSSVMAQLQGAQYGFFPPHEPERQTVFFGLHGGAMHLGAALDPRRGVLFVAASHVPSYFTITNGAWRDSSVVTGLSGDGAEDYSTYCAACHGAKLEGAVGPSLAELDPAYSRGRFLTVLKDGLRAMPAITDLEPGEIDALYRLLVLGEGVERAEADRNQDAPEDAVDGHFRRTAYRKLKDYEGYPGSRPPWGTLTAINLASGRHVWRVPLGRHDTLTARGLAPTGTENMAGPSVTSGSVVFVSGTKDRLIRAFDARTGAEVWEAKLPFIGSASPMVFEHEGNGYVVVPATGGGTLAIYDPDVQTGSSFVAFRVAR